MKKLKGKEVRRGCVGGVWCGGGVGVWCLPNRTKRKFRETIECRSQRGGVLQEIGTTRFGGQLFRRRLPKCAGKPEPVSRQQKKKDLKQKRGRRKEDLGGVAGLRPFK